MTAFQPDLEGIDLGDIDFISGPTPHWAFKALRRWAPVQWFEGKGDVLSHWAVTKHDDIVTVSRDPVLFSTELGGTALDQPPRIQVTRQNLISTDPPKHAQLRKLVNRQFTPRQIMLMEDVCRTTVSRILGAVKGKGQFDFVADVASILPMSIICELMGVPNSERDYLTSLYSRTFGAADPEFQFPGMDRTEGEQEARDELREYFVANLARNRRQSAENSLSGLIAAATVTGEALTDDEIIAYWQLLLAAGSETTKTAASGGLLTFMEHPDQWVQLGNDRTMLLSAVEEVLRWVSPVAALARTARRDVVLNGQQIRAGERLNLWYTSANRDEEHFESPDVFDIGRRPNDHIAFGVGEHYCLGANLARLELRVLFEMMLDMIPNVQVVGNAQYLRTVLGPAVKHLPVAC